MQRQARESCRFFASNPNHPSLDFKRVQTRLPRSRPKPGAFPLSNQTVGVQPARDLKRWNGRLEPVDGWSKKRPPRLLHFWRVLTWSTCHRGGTFEQDSNRANPSIQQPLVPNQNQNRARDDVIRAPAALEDIDAARLLSRG